MNSHIIKFSEFERLDEQLKALGEVQSSYGQKLAELRQLLKAKGPAQSIAVPVTDGGGETSQLRGLELWLVAFTSLTSRPP